MKYIIQVLIIFNALLFVPLSALAQDTLPHEVHSPQIEESNQEISPNNEIRDYYGKYHSIGIGLGATFFSYYGRFKDFFPALYTIDLSYQYQLASFYRMGAEITVGTHVFYEGNFRIFWTHDFTIFRNKLFELSLGVALAYAYSYFLYGEVHGDHDPDPGDPDSGYYHGLQYNANLSFIWRINSFFSLKLIASVLNEMVFNVRHEPKPFMRHEPHKTRNEFGGSIAIRSVFHF